MRRSILIKASLREKEIDRRIPLRTRTSQVAALLVARMPANGGHLFRSSELPHQVRKQDCLLKPMRQARSPSILLVHARKRVGERVDRVKPDRLSKIGQIRFRQLLERKHHRGLGVDTAVQVPRISF